MTPSTMQHPRVLLNLEKIEKIRQNYNNTTYGRLLGERIIADAKHFLNEPTLVRVLEGRRLFNSSRDAICRIMNLSLAFFLTNKKSYCTRAIAELKSVCDFSDWNPSHYLDTAEMSFAVAIGYDWLYDQLSPEERETIHNGMLKHGPRAGLVDDCGFFGGSNNWTQVCNGGMVAAVLAGDDEALRTRYVNWAVEKLPNAMHHSYYPKGSYPESSTYWSYGTEYNVLLIMMLENFYGKDFGLSALQGFSETGDFITAIIGDSGVPCCFGDDEREFPLSFAIFFLAERFNHPNYLTKLLHKKFVDFTNSNKISRFMPLAMLYVDIFEQSKDEDYQPLPLFFSGNEAVNPIVLRRKVDELGRLFLGIKAGIPCYSHGQMDAGSFVIEFNGVRFADDLKRQNYHRIESQGLNMWDCSQKGDRWKIFRLNHCSHNIIVVNDLPQNIEGKALFSNVADDEAVVELSPLYFNNLEVKRKFNINSSSSVTISDSLKGLANSDKVKFQFCSDATVVSNHNGILCLEKDGITVEFVAPANPNKWEVTPCNDLIQPYEDPCDGYSMFSIIFKSAPELDYEIHIINKGVK